MSQSDFRADLQRYRHDGKLEWYEPSLWVVAVYRFGRWISSRKGSLIATLLKPLHLVIFSALTLLTGIHLPRGARIGPGLKIWHFGGVFVSPDIVIGRGCTLRQGVIIGTRRTDHDVPTVGDDVQFGVGAILIGDIKIGDRAVIGAGAVVLCDVPPDHIAVGNPARCFPNKQTARQIGVLPDVCEIP